MDRIGLSFSGGLNPPDIVDCIQLADELGYESAWMAEGHGGDQFSILTACALRTKNILLGTSITSVFVRSAPTIAMAAASVDHFSNGRFVLGLGTSHQVQVEPEHGLVFDKAVPRIQHRKLRLLVRAATTGDTDLRGSGVPQDAGGLRRDIPGRADDLVHFGTRCNCGGPCCGGS